MTTFSVLASSSKSVTEWAARNELGLVPDAWPYGFNYLQRFGQLEGYTPRARFHRMAVARALVGYGRERSSAQLDRSDDAVALAWDENCAARMAPSIRGFDSAYSGVIWLSDQLSTRPTMRDRLVRSLLGRFTGLWCLSPVQVPGICEWFKGPVDWIRFGIDAGFYRYEPPSESKPLVLSIGGDRDRDPATLYRALSKVHARNPAVEFVVQSSSSVSPPDFVRRISRVSHYELRELYKRASVVAVATRENLHVSGMTVALEAMSTGRPVVVTETPGMDEYVSDGASGFLAEVGDSDQMAERINQILASPQLGFEMGRVGSADVSDRFTSSRMISDIVDFVSA